MQIIWRLTLLAVVAGLLSACATYSAQQQGVEAHLLSGQPQQALQALEDQPKVQRDHLAYLLNKSTLQRMDKQYSAANDTLQEAKVLIDKLDAVSLREQAGALTINESMRSYAGEDFEQVLVHLYAALNFIQQGELDSARVEALQVNVRLKTIAEDYENDNGAVYAEDPFARYLSGIIFETLGEWSDAMIAYRKAYQAYRRYSSALDMDLPESLKYDLIRLSARMGLDDELSEYQQAFSIDDYQTVAERSDDGELLVLLHNGLAPQKRDQTMRIINPKNRRLISVALPHYVNRYRHAEHAQLIINGQEQALHVVEDINAFARQTLSNHMPALTTRAIARAVAKDSMARRANNQGGPLVGFLVNIAGAVTEVADTRAWFTLPDNIMLARISLPPGEYSLKMRLFDGNRFSLGAINVGEITIQEGELTLHEQHWVRPY